MKRLFCFLSVVLLFAASLTAGLPTSMFGFYRDQSLQSAEESLTAIRGGKWYYNSSYVDDAHTCRGYYLKQPCKVFGVDFNQFVDLFFSKESEKLTSIKIEGWFGEDRTIWEKEMKTLMDNIRAQYNGYYGGQADLHNYSTMESPDLASYFIDDENGVVLYVMPDFVSRSDAVIFTKSSGYYITLKLSFIPKKPNAEPLLNYKLDKDKKTALVSQQEIGKNNYAGLEDVRIPSVVTINNITYTVVGIERYAFNNCKTLRSVTIPASVTKLYGMSFQDCSGLTKFIVSVDNPNYSTIDGVLFNKKKNVLVVYPKAKKANSYIIPQTVDTIGHKAFIDCKNLKEVELPLNLRMIQNMAFSGCDNIKYIRCLSPEPPQLCVEAFEGVHPQYIYVPAASIKKYSDAEWKTRSSVESWRSIGEIVRIQ